MYPTTRVFLRDDAGEKFFGEGPYRLLLGIERTGSLRSCAQEMGMAYTKALHLVRHAEETLGFPLTERTIGGKGGGGSRLTPKAKEFLIKYETYRDLCYQANDAIYRQVFAKADEQDATGTSPESAPPQGRASLGCVLMASGQGTRFGHNKLLAPLKGRPLIQWILDATDTDLITKRVVVTRHDEIAKICEASGIPFLLHDLPFLNDTIRLGLESFEGTGPDGCLFCTCDQPFLSRQTIERMAQAFQKDPTSIYRLSCQGTYGNPILFPRELYAQLRRLPKEKGGSLVAQKHDAMVRYVEAAGPWELQDVDTVKDLEALTQDPPAYFDIS